jgi:hypothetical protein
MPEAAAPTTETKEAPLATTVNGAATPEKKEGAEPTLNERRAELKEIARAEQAKLQVRNREKAQIAELQRQLEEQKGLTKSSDAELAEYRQWKELAAKDRVGAFKKLNGDAKELAEDILRSGTPDEKIAALSRELVEMRKRDADREEELKKERAELTRRETVANARKQMVSAFEADKSSLPLLSKLTKGDTTRIEREYMITWRLAELDPEANKLLHTFTDKQIFEATEARLVQQKEDLTAEDKGATVEGKADSGTARQGTEGGNSSAKTLTNSQAGERAASGGDDDLDRKKGESLTEWDKRINSILIDRLRKGNAR